jgi:uncharacterized membrane protein (UPF0127 family)
MRLPVLVVAGLLGLFALPACAAQPRDESSPAQLRDFRRTDISIVRQQGRDTFRVWLATTAAEQQQGLMWIRSLPADQGMLFLLDAVRPMDMWHIQRRTRPLSEDLVSSGGEVAGVLELLAGEAERRGIRTGDRILLPRL